MSTVTTPTTTADLRESILRHITYSLGETLDNLSTRDKFFAVALAVRDHLLEAALETDRRYREADAKQVYYLSMEFLMGRALGNNLVNLEMFEECEQATNELGINLAEVLESEPDAALGNGGLGRLAACFLDSMASIGLPGFGCGIDYQFGLFKQEIVDGQQTEKPDNWLRYGTPWLVERPEEAIPIPLFGRVQHDHNSDGSFRPHWVDCQIVYGVPNDMPIVGFGGTTVNILRLYAARASHDFDMQIFNEGDYINAVHQKVLSETISKVLYPSDRPAQGQQLRLIQEYFLVACSLHDIIRRFGRPDFAQMPEKVAIQLNDTHPSLAVAELMRILVDLMMLTWEEAWDITTRTLAYTNHTLMPEALERWPVALFQRVLPRHLEIIYEINRRFLDQVRAHRPGDEDRLRRMSIIEEGNEKQVRMAHLAIVGSHSVNGVAAVHSELVKSHLVPDFHDLWPNKFNNKTNGVTPRRWLLWANPLLGNLLNEAIGPGWVTDLDKLRALEGLAEDSAFQEKFLEVKRKNKQRLAKTIQALTGILVDDRSLIDSQVKRMHEYKRQLLNVLHIVWEYLRIIEDGTRPQSPRTFVFAGKAAPGYAAAKEIIHLIHAVGKVVNADPRCKGILRVAFVPDYRVTLAERIIPATDLSEQISTAGTEASGTGNMKFAMNGALTIGTLDGANIEIREEVGPDNIFIFGNTVPEIQDLQRRGVHPWEFYERSPTVRRTLDAFKSELFCPGVPGRFGWVFRNLVTQWDAYFHLADLDSYLQAHQRVDQLYPDRANWAKQAILNVARVGKFSSDRTIREYARDIWNAEPVLPS